MKLIELRGKGKGRFMQVDDEDYERLSTYNWYLGSNERYAVTCIHVGMSDGKPIQKNLSAHRVVLGISDPNVHVDHKNGNGLDNQKENLRECTRRQNMWNTPTKSRVTGVRKWGEASYEARIRLDGVYTSLGYYPSSNMAALAYDKEARGRGGFAALNYPEVTDYSAVHPLPKHNTGDRTSTQVGVSYSHKRKAKCKWRAVYRKKHIGWFATEEEAIAAYKEAKNES